MDLVTSCTKVRDWTKDGKSVPIYSVATSVGQIGESFGKEIPIGTPVSDLEITPNGTYAAKIKLKGATNSGGGFGGKKFGNESFALSYAKDVVIGGKTDIKNLFALADKMYDWLEAKKGAANPPIILASQLPQKEAPKPMAGNPATIPTDDLPF